MKYKKRRLVLFASMLVLMMTNINTTAFMGFGDSVSWKEEVLLHDGSKIIVERSQSYGGSHEIGQTPPVKEQSIKFTLPGTNKDIKWHDDFSKEIGRSNFTLLALHVLNDIPYIITTPRGCLSYNKWGRPNPPYVIFKYEKKVWQRIEITELPTKFENINLVIETKGDEKELLRQGTVTAENVKKLNKSLTQSEYKTILRTPIKIWCGEDIYVGNGEWYGKDWFTSRKSYDECIKFCDFKNISPEYCPCKKLFNIDSKGDK